MKKIIIILFVFTNLFAQSGLKMSSFVINDELNIDDPVDLKLGRYEAFEVNIGAGDNLAIELSSDDFWPVLLLMSPSKKSVLKIPSEDNVVRFDTTITEGGTWEFYVIGDTNTIGKYKCEVGFAEKGALIIEPDANQCEVNNFLVEHAAANFMFLRNKNKFRFPNILRNIDIRNGELSANVVSEKIFTEETFSRMLLDCLGSNWIKDKTENGRDGFRIRFVENVFKNKRYLSATYSVNGKENGYLIKIGKE